MGRFVLTFILTLIAMVIIGFAIGFIGLAMNWDSFHVALGPLTLFSYVRAGQGFRLAGGWFIVIIPLAVALLTAMSHSRRAEPY